MAPTEAAVPDVVSPLEYTNKSPNTSYEDKDLANAFFPQYLLIKTTRSSLFSAGKSNNIRSLSHLRGISTLQLFDPSHNLICRDLDSLPLAQDITMIHYIHDTILTGSGQQEVATTLDLLVKHLHVRGWEIKLDKYSEAFHLTEISRGPVVWGMSRYLF